MSNRLPTDPLYSAQPQEPSRDEIKAVEFVAEIRQVKTMADHTVNVTLNLPEYCKVQAAWFLGNQGSMIKGVSLLQSLTNGETETNGRTEGDPLGVVGG